VSGYSGDHIGRRTLGYVLNQLPLLGSTAQRKQATEHRRATN
jgi:hypothetical protein